jgi:hypothetical protein
LQKGEDMPKREIRNPEDFLMSKSLRMRAEINFIISKFLELYIEEQRELYRRLKSGDEGQAFSVAEELLSFVQNNPVGMAEFVSMGVQVPWKILSEDLQMEILYVKLYFEMYLMEQDGKFFIAKIL